MALDQPTNLPAGTRLGPYQITALLGAGGMGVVYRARDTRLGRDVAVKVLPPSLADDKERLRRFELEAQAAGRLNHPNLLAIYDVGVHEGASYLVTELLEGQTLRDRLEGAALPVRRAVEYGLQAACGLAAAHDKGIVHRDLKPENLFVTNDGRLKILDFGLAKLLPSPVGASRPRDAPTVTLDTDPGTVMGTVAYMSPEQVRGQSVDHRSDIFSLGVILYEMLSGMRAFRRDSAVETMNAILKEEPPELSGFHRAIPPALERIVRHCLEKSTEVRFQSARDLAFDLEAMSGVSSTSARLQPAVKSRRNLQMIVAALAVGMSTALFATERLARRAGRSEGASEAKKLPKSDHAAPPPQYHQLTFRRGTVISARFAPDGQTIYYGAAWDGDPVRLFSTYRDGPELSVDRVKNANILAISANKNIMAVSLGCHWLGNWMSGGTLARVPIGGGVLNRLEENVLEADWAADGNRLIAVRHVEGAHRLELLLPNRNSKTLSESKEGWYSHPRFAPATNQIAYIFHPIVGDDLGRVELIDPEGSHRAVPLTTDWAAIEGLAWSSAGDEIWFTADESGTNMALHAVTPRGRHRVVARVPGRLRLHDVSHDGRVLVAREMVRSAVFARGHEQTRDRDLSYLDMSFGAGISEDGNWVLVTEQGGNNYQELGGALYLRKTDGSIAERVGDAGAACLSPDGKRVAGFVQGATKLAILPTEPGQPSTVLEKEPIQKYHGAIAWFPDGESILFRAAEKGRGVRLYAQKIKGGPPQAITGEGIDTFFAIAPDGSTVAAIDSKYRLVLYTVRGGEEHPLPGLTGDNVPVQWTKEGRELYVRSRNRIPVVVEKYDLEQHTKKPFTMIEPADSRGLLELSSLFLTPDGHSYAYSSFHIVSELYLVEGLK